MPESFLSKLSTRKRNSVALPQNKCAILVFFS